MSGKLLFQWTEEFNIGIDEIDEQHHGLVTLLNQLHEAIREHHGSTASRQILDRLVEYTRTHFSLEESLMRLTNYPGRDAHKQQHEDLIRQVQALQTKLDEEWIAISFELLHFLKNWLMQHINDSDRRFGIYFQTDGLQKYAGKVSPDELIQPVPPKKKKRWWQRWFGW